MSGVTTQASSVKKTAASSELNTLVVLTQDRSDFLRRTLQYYRAYAGPVLVLDSSLLAEGDDRIRAPLVTYLHVPQLAQASEQDKRAHVAELVTTPYLTFAHDDDFILPGAMAESVSFLQDHPDYGFCHGYSLSYRSTGHQVDYFRRDKKVQEDFSSANVQERILQAMGAFISPFHAVTRTELLRHWYRSMPQGISAQWHETGVAWYLFASAKARVLPVPYAVREVADAPARNKAQQVAALSNADPASKATRESFAEFLASMSKTALGHDARAAQGFVLKSFETLLKCVREDAASAHELIVESTWKSPLADPVRQFGSNQYVELPFYNQTFFDQLADIEFLIGAIPAGDAQLQALEGAWVLQEQLLARHDNDTPETITDRLWKALDINVFNTAVVAHLADQLDTLNEPDEARGMHAWLQRLGEVATVDRHQLLQATPSGQLLNWLDARRPSADEAARANASLSRRGAAPQLGIFLLDLDDDLEKLQITLDSLVEGAYRSFKIVVFTTGEPPVATSVQNTLHFVKVSKSNYVDKLNQIARQSTSTWLLLAEAGDQFISSGLLRAALELQDAPQVRAVAGDEIQRSSNGALKDVFRPGFNLDLLLRVPALMARHWLVRKDVLLDVGGYSPDYAGALEFDLLLRIIEQGGPAWLAHLDEPLLIADAPSLQDNADERLTLTRHLSALGYKAQVTSSLPGTWQIDYRHSERPLVSLILRSEDNQAQLQRCLTAILQRTRYTRYEVLIADNGSQSDELHEWLDRQQQQNKRIRILRSEQRLSDAALANTASQHAEGEYLVFLSPESEVVNPNWIDALLNHAMRPEVGVVGAKLIDREGAVTGAGLILGMNGAVGSAFLGQAKDAPGYLQRLMLEQNYSAVSGACLMVRKALFNAVDGFDDDRFADAYADVDLCLKIGQNGFLTVWTPQVHIIHPGHQPDAPTALAAVQEKWAGAFAHDLAYNQNLALTGTGFTLGAASGVNWQQWLV
ncbi:TIGR00180 family glycosyltransferase [Pseudomonas abietaniphila]|uniref:TIGR00180 family glycosyltransferase n=1 Tax=Pseudomonas abietaniphila TaxID=89065 RepID=UPI003216CC20